MISAADTEYAVKSCPKKKFLLPIHAMLCDEITSLNSCYEKICAQFLPVTDEGNVWRYCGHLKSSASFALEQGWKLHVSATILNAGKIFEKVAPFLRKRKIRFKAPASLFVLKNLNAGVIYGYSQIGKFIVIYPQSDQEAVLIAEKLHRLTAEFSSPVVPYDLQLKKGSNIYYRYGSFKKRMILDEGAQSHAIIDPAGKQVPDLRDVTGGKPDWIANPFPQFNPSKASKSPLDNRYKIFEALSQRGKGGVYKAVDLSGSLPRLCVIKEGRRNGEMGWDGRDGFDRIKNEEKILKVLFRAGVNVPKIFDSFETEKSFYLVLEAIDGESLEQFLKTKKKRLSFSKIFRIFIEILETVNRIHKAGFIWRDLKPANLFVSDENIFTAIDFEGACPIKQTDPSFWGTRSFAVDNSTDNDAENSGIYTDFFAIGVTLFYLIEGFLPPSVNKESPVRLNRPNVPVKLKEILEFLLDRRLRNKFGVNQIYSELKSLYSECCINGPA